MRRHGLQLPLDPHQVGSIFVAAALVAGCYAFMMPFVENSMARWTLVGIYTAVVAIMVALNAITSLTDPSDPGLKGSQDGEYYCALCQASVGRSSKHCRACDRCVENFDHHCKWLNNCIGARNYKTFFALVISTVTMLLLQLGWGIYLFARSFYDKDQMKVLVARKYGNSFKYEGWQAALVLYMVLLTAACIMLGELLFFHLVLITKGMTTYDYIIAQRDRKLSGNSGSGSGAPGSGSDKQQHTLCSGCKPRSLRSSKVTDPDAARRSLKVSLNPCAAWQTEKLKGDPRSWDNNKTQSSMPRAEYQASAKGLPLATIGSNALAENRQQVGQMINEALARQAQQAQVYGEGNSAFNDSAKMDSAAFAQLSGKPKVAVDITAAAGIAPGVKQPASLGLVSPNGHAGYPSTSPRQQDYMAFDAAGTAPQGPHASNHLHSGASAGYAEQPAGSSPALAGYHDTATAAAGSSPMGRHMGGSAAPGLPPLSPGPSPGLPPVYALGSPASLAPADPNSLMYPNREGTPPARTSKSGMLPPLKHPSLNTRDTEPNSSS